MKLKNYIAIVAAGLLFSISACTDLSEPVYDSLPTFGNTLKEVNALRGSTYNTLKTYWPANFLYLQDCGGSMAVTPTRIGGDWYDGGQFREFYMHTWTSQTATIKNAWNAASTAIGTCNYNIQLLENTTVLSESEKATYIATIQGIRDFWIYVMLDNWGNIPLVTSYADRELPLIKPRQEVFNFLVKDVTDLIPSLPDGGPANYGQFTKGSAQFLLAKLYLNAEAWNVTVDGNAWQKCIDACDAIMGMGYIFEPDWETNFGINDRSGEGILTITFSETDTADKNELMRRTLHYQDNYSDGAGYSAWNGICAQPDYVKLFDPADMRYGGEMIKTGSFRIGKRYNITTGALLMTQHNAPLDYTVDMSMMPDSELDKTPWGTVVQEAGARCQKWPYSTSLTEAQGNHFHIFRYTDVYLMKAEALVRGGGDNTEATRLINEIRLRAFNNDNNKTYQSVGLEEIRLERKFEMAWEAYSRQDDIRFGTFEQGAWSASNCPRSVGDYLKLYPISQDAWQTNQNLVQNPGYAAFKK
ncbi:MAG: RagB/SusD family nutrient uptake outer membrane protein [Mediterranea sp.]|jgi:hypothetical protein|nr:RagB/SusD family nutrient uptake outer membrane protein [Mediterranea sp.]